MTLTEIRGALNELGDRLESLEVGGQMLWFDPTVPARTTRAHHAYLLPTFDEVCLTYAKTGFPRRVLKAPRPRLLSEAGGGIVVVGLEDVGIWKRTVGRTAVRVTLSLDMPLGRDDVAAVEAAAQDLAAFVERPLDDVELRVTA